LFRKTEPAQAPPSSHDHIDRRQGLWLGDPIILPAVTSSLSVALLGISNLGLPGPHTACRSSKRNSEVFFANEHVKKVTTFNHMMRAWSLYPLDQDGEG